MGAVSFRHADDAGFGHTDFELVGYLTCAWESWHRFLSNKVRLWPTIIAYNLGNLWQLILLPQRIEQWLLTSLQQRLVKTGGRLVKHARYY